MLLMKYWGPVYLTNEVKDDETIIVFLRGRDDQP